MGRAGGGPTGNPRGAVTGGEGAQPGQLVLVATPIGNLGDLSPRARDVLAAADVVCCEDTRRTRALLSAMGIAAGGAHGDRLLSLHGHNEESRVERVLSCLAGGGTVAVVSDAGTPGISDPGALLVSRAIAAGEAVSVVPGPTSVVAALVVSGLPVDRFCMEGFLPRKGGERRDRVAALMADQRTSVVLEAPGRVAATLAEMAAVDVGRRVAVVRELTKVHEEVWRGTMAEAAAAFAERPVRGEVVLVIAGAPAAGPVSDEAIDDAVRQHLGRGVGDGPRQIADIVAGELGVPRRKVYEAVLRLRGDGGRR
jgi:16S rRNA (cytidine1402-2'-O)-methyltransferase